MGARRPHEEDTVMKTTLRWRRLLGVYDADGGLLGELAYLTGRLVGVMHCSLCDITHGRWGEKPAFRAIRGSLGVPLVTIHRNDQPTSLRDLTQGRTPCVVGETAEGYELLLGRADLAACKGDVPCLEAALRQVIDQGKLTTRIVRGEARRASPVVVAKL
jgi:hypothetical protein